MATISGRISLKAGGEVEVSRDFTGTFIFLRSKEGQHFHGLSLTPAELKQLKTLLEMFE